MKEIAVKSQSMFDKKAAEITRLFFAVNPRMTEHPPFISIEPTFRDLDNYPPQYPNGVRLVLKKMCPYCEIEYEYRVQCWRTHYDTPNRPNIFPGSFATDYHRSIEEIRNLNPGICSDCVSTTYHNSRQSSENKQPDSNGGGFWDGFFKGLRGDK